MGDILEKVGFWGSIGIENLKENAGLCGIILGLAGIGYLIYENRKVKRIAEKIDRRFKYEYGVHY